MGKLYRIFSNYVSIVSESRKQMKVKANLCVMKSFLQTTNWMDFQKSLGREVFELEQGGIKAKVIKHPLYFRKSYLYIPHGPEIDLKDIQIGLQNEINNFIGSLKNLALRENSIFIKIEPLSDVVIELLYNRGFRHSKKDIQPHRTVALDLSQSEEKLLKNMHHKTRYNIYLSEKKNLAFEESSDIDVFWKLLQQTAKKDQFSTHPKEYYKELIEFFKEDGELQTKLFLVKHNSTYVCGAIVMIYHNYAYYLHGAMDRDYKSFMANYFMHWEIIKYLKNTKYNIQNTIYYDLWGIDAKKWSGVTRFKLGWGGEQTEYPGSFDLIISQPWYLAYRLGRRIM